LSSKKERFRIYLQLVEKRSLKDYLLTIWDFMNKIYNSKKDTKVKMWVRYFEFISLIILFTGVIMRLCGIRSGLYVIAISVVLTIYCSSWQIGRLYKKD
jgi:hypothetical protein